MTLASPQQATEALLLQTKLDKETQAIRRYLAHMDFHELNQFLSDDSSKKAFWINIYNAFFQLLSKTGKKHPEIYREKLVTIGQKEFSLDDIEHGILRRFRLKGKDSYHEDPTVPLWIRDMAVREVDFRIHFALNCGAVSCPPIAFYSFEKLEDQLEAASLSFLTQETTIDLDRREVRISKLFQWYEADFGGEAGTLEILERYLQKKLKGWKIIYEVYDWSEKLNNYID